MTIGSSFGFVDPRYYRGVQRLMVVVMIKVTDGGDCDISNR